ncbi:MAG TPA: hypothetical protein VL688_05240 [Verrucomicrobiae bacterium]|nr:hypothetical protein [Verrucomicrobiae bacterium]
MLQVDSPNVTSVLLELTDAAGKKDTARLVQVDTFGKRWLIQGNAFFGIDLTKIQTFSFVFEGAGAKTLNISWGNFDATLKIAPDATKTEADITKLPLLSTGQRPFINGFAKADGSLSTVTVLSENFAKIQYSGQNETSFGGAFIAYDDPTTTNTETFNYNAVFPNGVILQVDSPNITSVLVEVEDITGKKDTVELVQIENFGKRWVIPANGFFNMDMAHVKTMSFVFLGTGPATLNLVWGDWAFTPQVPGTPFNEADLHNFVERPDVNGFGGNVDPRRIPGFITLNKVNPRQFNFTYDLVGSQTAFVVTSITKGFFNGSGVFQGTPLSLPASFTMALQGDSSVGVPQKVRVNIVDTTGKKVTLELLITSDLKNYTIDLTNPSYVPSGFNRGSIAYVELVVDRDLAGPDARRGKINVQLKGTLNVVPLVNGQTFDQNALHVFNEKPDVNSFGGAVASNQIPGFITTTVRNPRDFDFVYDLIGSSGAFVVTNITKGFFDGSNNFQGTSLALPSVLQVALQGDSAIGVPQKVRINVIDVTGKTATFELVVTSTLQNFSLDLSNPDFIPAGFDRSHVARIEMIVDRALAGADARRGKVYVKVGGILNFIPQVTGQTFDPSTHHVFNEKPDVNGFGGNVDPRRIPGFITTVVRGPKDFDFTYDLGGSQTAFVVASITKGFFDANNVFQGQTLALPQVLTMSLQGDSSEGVPQKVRVTITDKTGKKATFDVLLTSSQQNFSFDLNNPDNVPAGFNRNEVARIEFVVDRTLAGASAIRGKVKVKVGGILNFVPVLDGQTFDAAAITAHANNPNVTATGSNVVPNRPAGAISLNQISSDEFEYAYNLQASDSAFTFVNISGASPETLPESFVIAARGHEGAKVKVEIKDINGKLATFILKLRPAYQNYVLDLSAANVVPGFDRTKIAQVVFVEDRSLAPVPPTDLVQIMTKGVHFTPPPPLAPELLAVKADLVSRGVDFFEVGAGIDPTTHFPYDAINDTGVLEDNSKFTQPTLIGFYLQMLADAVNGKIDFNGKTQTQLLTEISFVMDKLLSAQTQFGWNGLLPFLDLQPYEASKSECDASHPGTEVCVGLGDNANLAQSLAVMVGALERAGLSGSNLTTANSVATKVEQFLDNQEDGYQAFVHPIFGVFRSSVNTENGNFNSFVDRIGDEFRGAVAFLKVRFPSLPDTVWDNLATVVRTYQTQDGKSVTNLAAFDGSMFQIYWPSLRNNERDFMGFRNALYNQFVAHSDFASKFRIPGFLSAAETPDNHEYVGDLGVREIAEWAFSDPVNGLLLMDTGSTYALASAFQAAPEETMTWLKAISEIQGIKGTYGILDSARSATEIAKRWLGIDLASTVLGLTGAGPDDFETYLRKRGLELNYNLLYDEKSSALGINKTSGTITAPPQFPDRSFGVLRNSHISSIENFHLTNEADNDFRQGAHFKFGQLPSGFGGVVFHMNAPFNAVSSQLVIQYSVKDNPGPIKLEFQDASGQSLFTKMVSLQDQTNSRAVQKLTVDLPNDPALANVAKVVVIIEQGQSGGDTSGEFLFHAMDFQHVSS